MKYGLILSLLLLKERLLNIEKKPFIEQTMTQQLLTTIESASVFSGKIKKASLLDIALQLNSRVKTSMISYMKLPRNHQKIHIAAVLP